MNKSGDTPSVRINPTWEQTAERDPIIAFSFYLSGRKNVLLAIATEITEDLDQAFSGRVVDGRRLERAESLMWLWILGAYEVVRTMCQAKGCFSQRALERLTQFKKNAIYVANASGQDGKIGKEGPSKFESKSFRIGYFQ